MTTKTTEARRAAFHASKVASALNLNIDEDTGQYRAYGTECSWRAWNEALDSLCVELPLRAHNSWHDYDQGYNQAHSECQESLTAAGVPYK